MTVQDEIIREFHRLYYERGIHGDYGRGLHAQTRYHGVEAHKCPFDLWVYQEILFDVRPSLVVELGTYLGGTTLFLAHQLDALGGGLVFSIDREELPRPQHGRIRYLRGQTNDGGVLATVRDAARSTAGRVLVIHDADHRYAAVREDLENYAGLVTPGSYVVVEDTNVNGHPVLAGWGPGPWEAVDDFLRDHPEFGRDRSREKFMLTYNPGGYLRRREA